MKDSMVRAHDFIAGRWGHDCNILEVMDHGHRLRVVGWGGDDGLPNEGDFLLLANGRGSTRYQIMTVRHEKSPEDMWFAEAVFAPRWS